MKDNISPEEKLLRLIRGSKKTDALKNPAVITGQGRPEIKPAREILPKKYLSVLSLKKIALVASGVSFLYLIATFIQPIFSSKEIKLPELSKDEIVETQAGSKISPRPFEFYLKGVQGRQIFSSAETTQAKATVGEIDSDLIKDISLVGIISGDNPQAIIEDKKSQKTYYVNKGQFLNGFQVEDIQSGKIILNRQGQRFELYL